MGVRSFWQDTADIAYSDVRAAFLHYLEHWNNGRLIVQIDKGTCRTPSFLCGKGCTS